MEFLILGPLEVSDDGRKLTLGGPKQRAVLAHLILRSPDGRSPVLSPLTGGAGPIYLMRDGSQIFQIGLGSEASWRPEPG